MSSTTRTAFPARPALPRLGRIRRFLRQLPQAYIIYFERRALMALSDRALKDLGLSRSDVYREANRSWWDVPENR